MIHNGGAGARDCGMFRICVDGSCREMPDIKMYHRYFENPKQVADAGEMLFEAEKLLDDLGYPQPSFEFRSFRGRQRHQERSARRRRAAGYMTEKDLAEKKGAEATFVVHVKYRQNATWQGSVVWAEKNITKNFRSALELLKLIDSALAPGSKKTGEDREE